MWFTLRLLKQRLEFFFVLFEKSMCHQCCLVGSGQSSIAWFQPGFNFETFTFKGWNDKSTFDFDLDESVFRVRMHLDFDFIKSGFITIYRELH